MELKWKLLNLIDPFAICITVFWDAYFLKRFLKQV